MFKQLKVASWLHQSIKSRYNQPDEMLVQSLWSDLQWCEMRLKNKERSLFNGGMLIFLFAVMFVWGALFGAWLVAVFM